MLHCLPVNSGLRVIAVNLKVHAIALAKTAQSRALQLLDGMKASSASSSVPEEAWLRDHRARKPLGRLLIAPNASQRSRSTLHLRSGRHSPDRQPHCPHRAPRIDFHGSENSADRVVLRVAGGTDRSGNLVGRFVK